MGGRGSYLACDRYLEEFPLLAQGPDFLGLLGQLSMVAPMGLHLLWQATDGVALSIVDMSELVFATLVFNDASMIWVTVMRGTSTSKCR